MPTVLTTKSTCLSLILVLTFGLLPGNVASGAPGQATAGAAGLTIVVIAGEGAVNIIQQKTAVAPVVEVRDRNNQPVAGAVVRFAIQGWRASFDGARAVTLVTNAAGRAAVTSLTPTASGAVEIGASASFQGQVATATIIQTNFVTVAAAAAAATATAAGVATAAGGAAAGGAAAGGGIGMSATTLAIVGGAAVGDTVVTTRVTGAGSGGIKIYEGEFRIDVVESVRHFQATGQVSLSPVPTQCPLLARCAGSSTHRRTDQLPAQFPPTATPLNFRGGTVLFRQPRMKRSVLEKAT